MGLECGRVPKEIAMWVSGGLVRLTDMGCMCGLTVTGIKAISNNV